MRNAFVKDSLRQVRNTISRFLAILCITALGVAFFAGLKATAPDMRTTAQNDYSARNMMDIRVVSTAGFTGDDVSALRAVAGVKGVMPSYSADAVINLTDSSLTVKLISLDTDQLKTHPSAVINQPELVSGRMPQNDREVLADPRLLHYSKYKVGDSVTLEAGNGTDIGTTLKKRTFTIVGAANDPLYISYERGSSTIGNGKVDAYLILPSSAFALSVYTDVYLTVENPSGISRFDSGFDALVSPVTKAVKALSTPRTQIRYDQIQSEGQAKIDDAKAKLANGQQALSNAEQRLNSAQAQINANQAKLETAQSDYDAGQAAYLANLSDYQDSLTKYNAGVAQLTAAKNGMSDADIENKISLLQQALQLLPKSSPDYQKNAAILAGLQTILAQEAQLASAEQTLQQGKAQLDAGAATLAASKAQLDSGYRQLSDAKEQLAAGRQAYAQQKADAQPELDSAAQLIADGETQLAAVKKPVWYVLDRNTNEGFVSFQDDANRIAAISNVFPLIFFLVAILVSLTTMTRLVEDDRTHIGTMKALGYSKGAIALKYILYAVCASLLGSLIGLVIGYNVFPRVIFNAYCILYTLPDIIAGFNIPYAILSTLVAVACATLPALLVCVSSLHSSPAGLMRPKVPAMGKRILLERFGLLWRHLNFSQKVTARNLFRYKKRLIMTIVGVAGCTGLIFTGFGLRDAIMPIVSKQYGEIRTYGMEVDVKENAPSADMATLEGDLSSHVTGSIRIRQQSVDLLRGNQVKSVSLVVPVDGNSVRGYIDLRERSSGKKLSLDNDTVIITEKLSIIDSLKKGDTIRLRDTDGVEHSVKIGGITENYLFHYIYMSPTLYQKLFGSTPQVNQLLCRLSSSARPATDALSKSLMKDAAVSSVDVVSSSKENFQKMIVALNFVVIVLIISAALLAFVVLFSLTSINIDERSRELATIKVLGFYNGELASYIYRENVVLTVVSSLVGLVLGIFMQRFVITTAEVDLVMFSRTIAWQTYLYSAGLTLLFAFFVNFIMYRRFQKIDMVSSLKSNE